MNTVCKLCLLSDDLRNSHAIPDAFFRRILAANNGHAKILDSSLLGYKESSDSWATYQLCGVCEQHLNSTYERYSIGVLRGHGGVAKRSEAGVTFSGIDTNRICIFLISILWRAACSNHDSYNGAVFPYEFYKSNTVEKLRLSIYQNLIVPTNLVSIKISRIFDSKVGFSADKLKDLIVAPFHRPFGEKGKVSVNFVIEGFLITLIMPGISHKERRRHNIINRTKNFIFAPYLEITNDIDLEKILVPKVFVS
ncbi:MAG: hypothetical protein MK185_16075 [Saccharospirillaceae bacterium]|nr:hypothetical protein [Saccharospirillaceae bacterium]